MNDETGGNITSTGEMFQIMLGMQEIDETIVAFEKMLSDERNRELRLFTMGAILDYLLTTNKSKERDFVQQFLEKTRLQPKDREQGLVMTLLRSMQRNEPGKTHHNLCQKLYANRVLPQETLYFAIGSAIGVAIHENFATALDTWLNWLFSQPYPHETHVMILLRATAQLYTSDRSQQIFTIWNQLVTHTPESARIHIFTEIGRNLVIGAMAGESQVTQMFSTYLTTESPLVTRTMMQQTLPQVAGELLAYEVEATVSLYQALATDLTPDIWEPLSYAISKPIIEVYVQGHPVPSSLFTRFHSEFGFTAQQVADLLTQITIGLQIRGIDFEQIEPLYDCLLDLEKTLAPKEPVWYLHLVLLALLKADKTAEAEKIMEYYFKQETRWGIKKVVGYLMRNVMYQMLQNEPAFRVRPLQAFLEQKQAQYPKFNFFTDEIIEYAKELLNQDRDDSI